MQDIQTPKGAQKPQATNPAEPSATGIRGRPLGHRRALTARSRSTRRYARNAALVIGAALPFVFVLAAFGKDTTAPVVKFEIKQGSHFVAVKTATMSSGEPLTVRAVVRDPQGVKSLRISFPPVTSNSCTVSNLVYTGSFPITLPHSKSLATTGLHTTLAKDVTIPYPKCEVLGSPSQTGAPIGHTFSVVLVGRNRSPNSSTNQATTTLKVKMQ